MNQVMEQYLRAHVDYQQENWVAFLATCEFTANNKFSESLKTFPFLANYGVDPCLVESLAPLQKARPDAEAQDLTY